MQVDSSMQKVLAKERASQSKALDLQNQLSRAKAELSQQQRSKEQVHSLTGPPPNISTGLGEETIQMQMSCISVTFLFLQMECEFQSQLQSMKTRLELSDAKKCSLQNYVQHLRTAYGNVFGDCLLTD